MHARAQERESLFTMTSIWPGSDVVSVVSVLVLLVVLFLVSVVVVVVVVVVVLVVRRRPSLFPSCLGGWARGG